MIFFLVAPIFVFPVLIAIHFFGFVFLNRELLNKTIFRLVELFTIAILPLVFRSMSDYEDKNDCCNDGVFFSPAHRLSIYVLIVVCVGAYFYSAYRKKILPPVLEIIVNCFLIIGIVLNLVMGKQETEDSFFLLGNLPIILLFILVLIKNQRMLILHLQSIDISNRNIFTRIMWRFLGLNIFIKFPLLVILCLPLLIILTTIFLVFGQKPDALIRAFTDTYHLGFSQLNSECDNVNCGGHYLCSVAANGHRKFVKPQRSGKRNGHTIICNRQLLVSNAFEELMQEKLPFLHRKIRRVYNKVGDVVHRYYSIFNNKFVADTVYILMKPLQWLFIIVLYTFDRKPENRIAVQYLSKKDRLQLKNVNK